VNRPPSPLNMLLSRHTRRREFITLIAGAAILPHAAQAQQPAMPVVGFLGVTSAGTQPYLTAFRQGIGETGYVEGPLIGLEARLSPE
jgi:putative ABC transport system substrate-binding protein